MGRELEDVEKPFVAQLQTLGWAYTEGSLDTPALTGRSGFTEVIQASLAGQVYFIDLKTGKASRNPISIGNPIKGSVAVHPYGVPMLYVGDGINETGKVGFRLFSLIDQKMLHFFTTQDRQVLANGQIRHNGLTGSIHMVGRTIQNAPSCNGWEHWYFEDADGQRHPINLLRDRLRTSDTGPQPVVDD